MNAPQKVFLVVSLLGILLLLFLSQKLAYENRNINEITEKDIGKSISITGNLLKIADYDSGFNILTITDGTGNITGIVFSKKDLKEQLEKNRTYVFSGKIQKYNETLEIVLEKIK